MLKGEVWLCHRELWTEHFEITLEPWVLNLGWMKRFETESRNSAGWIIYGEAAKEPSERTLYPIVSDPQNRSKLFKWNGSGWEHFPGPLVFAAEGLVAGYAGLPVEIDTCKAKSSNPWQWEGIQVIEVDPVTTVRVTKPTMNPIISYGLGKTLTLFSDTLDPNSPEVLKAAERGVTFKRLDEKSVVVDTTKVSVTTIKLPTGFDMKDIRAALADVDTAYAWISDVDHWNGWFPEYEEDLQYVHLFADAWGQYGGTLFVPVQELLHNTTDDGTLNDFTGLKFHDRKV